MTWILSQDLSFNRIFYVTFVIKITYAQLMYFFIIKIHAQLEFYQEFSVQSHVFVTLDLIF